MLTSQEKEPCKTTDHVRGSSDPTLTKVLITVVLFLSGFLAVYWFGIVQIVVMFCIGSVLLVPLVCLVLRQRCCARIHQVRHGFTFRWRGHVLSHPVLVTSSTRASAPDEHTN